MKSRLIQFKLASKSLGKEMASLVYLPADYENEKALPCLYFNHGRSGNEQILTEAGINKMADRLIGSKVIRPMIIVCPNLDNSHGINSSAIYREVYDSSGRTIHLGSYEDYLIDELIPSIDQQFKTIKSREGRFIGGASAGGYVALHTAFRHPEIFSKVGGHMPAVDLELEDEDLLCFQNQENWAKYDPLQLAGAMSCTSFQVYLDAGDQDEGEFYKGCAALYQILKERGVPAVNSVYPGHHNMDYIRENMEKYLFFYGSRESGSNSNSIS